MNSLTINGNGQLLEVEVLFDVVGGYSASVQWRLNVDYDIPLPGMPRAMCVNHLLANKLKLNDRWLTVITYKARQRMDDDISSPAFQSIFLNYNADVAVADTDKWVLTLPVGQDLHNATKQVVTDLVANEKFLAEYRQLWAYIELIGE